MTAAARFSPLIEIEGPDPRDTRGRIRLYHTGLDRSFLIGSDELALARLFDGVRSLADIAEQAKALRRKLGLDAAARFEHRLLAMGLLETDSQAEPATANLDPSAGIQYGPFKHRLMLPLFRLRPDRLIGAFLGVLPAFAPPIMAYGMLVAISLAFGAVLVQAGRFGADAWLVFSAWTWLIWYLPIRLVGVTLHEFGHAIACRLYGVRTTEIGAGLYLVLVTGWAKPVQRSWSALSSGPRLVTIAMGPLVGLSYAAFGIALWLGFGTEHMLGRLGMMIGVIVTLSHVPTLMPFLNGDAYLALTEMLGEPALRQKALAYARASLSARSRPYNLPLARRALYWTTAISALIGPVLIWAGLAGLLFVLTT
jgi:putative peptide zinc metalloprotease protein